MSLATTSRELPDLEPNRRLTLPDSVEATLPNGLTVIAIERRSVPLVEVRLRVPLSATTADPWHVAVSSLMSRTLLSGTADMSTVDIAAALQGVGGGLSASVDPDRLLVSGAGLASGLERILTILGDVVHGATYPENEVVTERARLIDRIQVAQTQPSHLVREALLRRIYGNHPYGLQTARPADLEHLGRDELARMHAARVRPAGATLVISGDIDPQATVELAGTVLGSWTGAPAGADLPGIPPLAPGPLVLAHRPNSVQSSLRLALPAVTRTHPDYAALQLANLIFGGYFSSRWVENIREDKGYTYGPHSGIDHSVAGSRLIVAAEVATDVTAPALLETWYELGRIASIAPGDAELEQARQYALGSLLLGMSTQAGLASLASMYAAYGLRLDFLVGHADRLTQVTKDDVARAAATYLAPAKAVTVVLGDTDLVEGPLRVLSTVERAGD
jgi:zinc protease